jgi:hypothetical protein
LARPFRTPREHLDEAVALVGQLVERQIHAHWETGVLPRVRDKFSGTFVAGDTVSALMKGAAPTAEGEQRLADLDAAIAAREERIEERLAAAHEQGEPLPFDRLRRAFALSPTEQRALWVLVAIEINQRLRQLMRYLVDESTRVHADVGLLELLVYGAPDTRELMIHELAPNARLFRYRLVERVGGAAADDAPFLLRPLRVAHRAIELVHGVVRLDRELDGVATLVQALPPHDALVVPAQLAQETTQLVTNALAAAESGVAAPVIVMSGAEGAGRKSLVAGAARQLGCGILLVHCDSLPHDPHELSRTLGAIVREAILFHAIPLFDRIDALAADVDRGRPDRGGVLDRELAGFVGPVAATCTRRDSRPIALARGLVLVDVPLPGEAARAELWRRALGGQTSQLSLDSAAARYPITGGTIARAAESAIAHARARGPNEAVTDHDLHAGVRSTLDAKLSTLGVRVAWRQTWSDLVLPEDSLAEIREFIARVRHRRRVYDEWGFARKIGKGLGLSALFAGPPGTGKTMVAGIIADALALDLYQIDLSRIVSKYVGETEKNLANVFDAAEAGHAILLFDEADSLFAKRTEVKSSVDRYANLEVNYLLQRMEQFNGITILTTNLDASIDDAFRRRISFRVDFPMPEAEHREQLWRAMLPKQAAVDPAVNFRVLASKYEFSGGYIRNAVVRAAFLAADESSAITMHHLERAALLEYTAMGKLAAGATHS